MIDLDKTRNVYDFIHSQHVCVISTINQDGKPESAAMAFSETEDLKIIFQTPNDTRKYRNLVNNKSISIVVGWSLDDFITVQYEGIAREATDQQVEWCRNIHISKNEKSQEYAYLEQNKYFIVEPKWIRFSDINNQDIFELKY